MKTTDNQEELFVVVDEHDVVLGSRTRYDCHHDTSLIHRGISIVLFDTKGRVLLQKRSATKDTYPGYWSTAVGGHVAVGETYEQSAYREMQEELGIKVPIVFRTKYIHKYPHETEMEMLFTAIWDGPFTPNAQEIDRVEFFEPRVLRELVRVGKIQLTDLADSSLKFLQVL